MEVSEADADAQVGKGERAELLSHEIQESQGTGARVHHHQAARSARSEGFYLVYTFKKRATTRSQAPTQN